MTLTATLAKVSDEESGSACRRVRARDVKMWECESEWVTCLEIVNVKAYWREMDSPRDTIQFIAGTVDLGLNRLTRLVSDDRAVFNNRGQENMHRPLKSPKRCAARPEARHWCRSFPTAEQTSTCASIDADDAWLVFKSYPACRLLYAPRPPGLRSRISTRAPPVSQCKWYPPASDWGNSSLDNESRTRRQHSIRMLQGG